MCYPLKFRQHVLQVKHEEGLTFQETSARFRIGVATLFRWARRLEPKETRERTPRKIPDDVLRQQVEDHPDMYHYERARHFGVHPRSIGKALKRLGITRKKNQPASQSRRSYAYSPRSKNKKL